MIFITGDCHGKFDKFDLNNFPEQAELTKEDYVLICGDFGGASSHDAQTDYFDNIRENIDFDSGISDIIIMTEI